MLLAVLILHGTTISLRGYLFSDVTATGAQKTFILSHTDRILCTEVKIAVLNYAPYLLIKSGLASLNGASIN